MEQKWVNKLNNDEFNLIENDWYPIIKKSAMDKIKAQLLESGELLQSFNPNKSYKISAGERLQDLPYLVLDFPKMNNLQFNFVYRTLFWWGRGIQFQLVFQGVQKELYTKVLTLAQPTDFILLGSNLWENDIHSEHFQILEQISEPQQLELISGRFFKLVRSKPIENKENIFEGLSEFYEQFEEVLS
jgi:hypothetical protein